MFRPIAFVVFASLLSVFAVALSAANAQEPKPLEFSNPNELFKKLDANSDGQLTKDEIPDEHRRLFERLLRIADKQGDGKLSADEFKAGLADAPEPGTRPEGAPQVPGAPRDLAPNPDDLFKRMDRNGDGKVTIEEVPEERRENFQRMFDRLGKKEITKEDFAKVMGEMRGRPGAPAPPTPPANPVPGTPPAPRRPDAPPMPPGTGDIVFRLFDKDGDGSLSADEISAAADALKKLDKNGDGKVSREELLGGVGQPRPGTPPETRPNIPGAPAPGIGNRAELLRNRVKAMDKNNDGKISSDEADGMVKERFDILDTNKDGSIDEQELKQMLDRLNVPRP